MKPRSVKPRTVKLSEAAMVVGALTLAFVPIPPRVVERLYATGFYALVQPPVTFVSNAIPFAAIDALGLAVLAAAAVFAVRDIARLGGIRGIARASARLLAWGAAIYIVFLVTWGLNYRRERLVDRLPYDRSAVTAPAAARLASVSVDRVNALHAAAHAEGWVSAGAIDPALAGAFDRAVRTLGSSRGIVVGRPKRSLLDWYFLRAGVAGMTDPFLLETLVASDLLPFERPLVVAHEWSHLAGIADEGEANFAGWLACLNGSTADQYSGWLFMYGEAIGALPPHDRGNVAARLEPGPRADLIAIRERTLRHVNARISTAGWRVYDSYLKANRVEAGAASYAEVVRLALGLRVGRAAY